MHCPALVTFIQDKEPKYWTVPLNTRHLATLFVTLIQEMSAESLKHGWKNHYEMHVSMHIYVFQLSLHA